MNKYQEKLLKGASFRLYDALTQKNIALPYTDGTLKIIQDKDITHTSYFLIIDIETVSKIEILENGKYKNLKKENLSKYLKNDFFQYDEFIVNFDFNKQDISKIKLYFKNDLADPLEIPVEYIEASKEEYYQNIEKERIKELQNKINPKHTTGECLVNIRFKNCNEHACVTKIKLFDNNKQLMGTFTVEKDMFYKAISNLAYDHYFYIIEQYDKENKLIVSTDYIKFSLYPVYGPKILS